MKIAITTTGPEIKKELPVSLLTGDFFSRMQKAARLGFDGIELIVNEPEKIDPSYISETVKKNNLEIAAISTGGLAFLENLTILSSSLETQRKAVLRLKKIISFAGEINAPIVTIGSFRGKLFASDTSYLKTVMHDCAEFAEKIRVKLVIEPLNRYESNFINNVDEALSFIDELSCPNIGLLIDTFHANIEERSLTQCFIQANTAQKLWHIHIGESNRYPLGLGHIDFPSIFETLENIQYKGFISAELLPRPDPDSSAAITIEYCRAYLENRN